MGAMSRGSVVYCNHPSVLPYVTMS